MDPQRTGIFLGQCAHYCGMQHGKMLLRVVVESRCRFRWWVRAQQQTRPETSVSRAGRRVFETTACINCSRDQLPLQTGASSRISRT